MVMVYDVQWRLSFDRSPSNLMGSWFWSRTSKTWRSFFIPITGWDELNKLTCSQCMGLHIAQMAEHCGANARLLLSTGLIHKRSQFAQGHVFQAVWCVPSRFVPDSPLTIIISCNWSVLRSWMQVMVLYRIQLYSTKYIKNKQMIQNYYSGVGLCMMRCKITINFLSTSHCFVF